jgi:hypothetical protein
VSAGPGYPQNLPFCERNLFGKSYSATAAATGRGAFVADELCESDDRGAARLMLRNTGLGC